MSRKINIEDNKQLKENPFKVPEGYFKGLENKLQSIAQEDPVVIQMKPRPYRRRLLAIAATVTILLAATWLVTQTSNTTDVELSAEEIAQLTENGYVTFTETELLEFVTIEDLDDFWPETENEDLEDYLKSTDLDYVEEYYLYENI